MRIQSSVTEELELSNQVQAFSEATNRYAGALLELADQKNQVDLVAGDLQKLEAAIRSSKDLAAVLANPLVRRNQAAAALEQLASALDVCDLTKRFVGLVAKNGRAIDLRQMAAAFASKLALRRGEVRAHITSALPLSDDQVSALTSALAQELGSKVQIDARVDASILGGLIIRVGSKMIDASLKTKLEKLKLSLSKGLTTKGVA